MAEKLFTEFPPVSTAQWEEVITKDLKLGRRQTQNETIEVQAHEIEQLKERIKQLEEELMRYKSQG